MNLDTIASFSVRPLFGHPGPMEHIPGYFPEALMLTALGAALVVTGYR